jgi:DNA-binding NarL/FixJ family response regulator
MRVVIVGPAALRARVRAAAEPALDIIGEFATLSSARASGVDYDALLLAEDRVDAEDPSVESLTPREADVLELLAEGMSNMGIAARLGISDQTVKFHVAAICGKLGADNRTDAVRRAIRRGLIAL